MRRHIAVVTLLLSLFAVSAFAQGKTDNLQKGTFRVFGFGSNFGYSESDLAGSNWHGGYGLGLEYRFSDRWSSEVSISREQTPTWTYGVLGPDGQLTTQRFKITSHPIDAVGQYHFFTDNAFKPFVGLGLRYVGTSDAPFAIAEESRLAPQLVGGFYYNFTSRLGLRVDVKRLLSSDSTYFDDSRKVSVGLGWKF